MLSDHINLILDGYVVVTGDHMGDLKNFKKEWPKIIFFMKEDLFGQLCHISSDFKTSYQVSENVL